MSRTNRPVRIPPRPVVAVDPLASARHLLTTLASSLAHELDRLAMEVEGEASVSEGRWIALDLRRYATSLRDRREILQRRYTALADPSAGKAD